MVKTKGVLTHINTSFRLQCRKRRVELNSYSSSRMGKVCYVPQLSIGGVADSLFLFGWHIY